MKSKLRECYKNLTDEAAAAAITVPLAYGSALDAKKVFRRLSVLYHPDKVVAEEGKKAATEHMQKLNEWHDYIVKHNDFAFLFQ